MNTQIIKQPPQCVDAEKALLGSIMLYPELIEKISKKIKPEFFYETKNRIVFYAMNDMLKRGTPIDLLTVTDRIKKANKLDEIGGSSYLAEIVGHVPSGSNSEHYADLIKQSHKARLTLALMEDISKDIYSDGHIEDKTQEKIQKLSEVIDVEFESDNQNKLLDEMCNFDGEDKVVSLKEIYDLVDINNLEGMKTGWEEVDKLINGMRPSHLINLTGLMKSGKTSFAMDMSTRLNDYNPLWLAIEETIDELMIKFKQRGEQPPKGFSPKSLAPVTVKWIERKIAEGIKKFNTKVVFIDNLSWIKLSSKSINKNKADVIEETMQEIKTLAKKWNIVIVMLAHVNGDAEPDKVPTYAMLKGSTGIGQIGDKTVVVWRECKKGDNGELIYSSNVLLSVQLNRQGPLGNVKMVFDNGHYREYDWKQDDDGFGDFSNKSLNYKDK